MVNTTSLITIIIANFNSEKFIRKCLESILDASGNFEVIIVDTGSEDLSPHIIKKYKVQFLIDNSNKGPVHARNIGAAQSKGDILLFLDCDTVVDTDCLTNLEKFLKDNQEIGAGQLKLLRWDRKNVYDSAGDKISPLGFLTERARETVDNGQYDYIEPIISGKGAALFIRKSIFDTIGGFDEDYFMYWEEPDLLWRVWKSGYKVVFFPFCKVWHMYNSKLKPVTTTRLNQITYLGCRNQLMTIIKNGEGYQQWLMITSVSMSWTGLLLMFIIKFDFQRAHAITRALIWVLSHLFMITKKHKAVYRKRSDSTWMSSVTTKNNLKWFIGKGLAYVNNKPF